MRCRNHGIIMTDNAVVCNEFRHKTQTNGDRIRAITDEELAEFLWSIGQNPVTGNTYLNGKFIFFCGNGNGWLDWLKREVSVRRAMQDGR